MNYIKQRQEEIKKSLTASFSQNSLEAASAADFLEKGKKANLGEVREWKGGKYQKTTQGWVEFKENGGKTKEHKDKPSKVVMNKEIMDGLKALKVDSSNYEKLKSHYGGQENLHAAIGDLLEGKGELPQDVLYGDGDILDRFLSKKLSIDQLKKEALKMNPHDEDSTAYITYQEEVDDYIDGIKNGDRDAINNFQDFLGL